jgi:gamma-glutamylcyclotransferase (GGCT)/AIG2-like uncharacterized protein YtfP
MSMITTNQTRQLNKLFRFDESRNASQKTCYVFAHGYKGDSGVFGAPAAALLGFEKTQACPSSVAEKDSALVVGRLLELSEEELARLDAVAERQGDYHRFRTTIIIPLAGFEVEAWCYQLRSDSTPLTELTSADCEESLESVFPV